MIIDGTVSEDINQYKILYLDGTDEDYLPLSEYSDLNKIRKYTAEFLNFLPEELISNNNPKIFKYKTEANTRMILLVLELEFIKNMGQIDFYLENSYKFSIVLEDLDRRYSQMIQIGYGEDKTPNLSAHILNPNPHSELLTVGLMNKMDNIDIPSTLYAESITTFGSESIIGNTLVTRNFGKYYIGEIDEQPE